MIILAIDPSGNFKEGKGTSGLCLLKDKEIDTLWDIQARDYVKDVAYWHDHIYNIEKFHPDFVVIEGYRLYNHRGMAAASQANSELETSQLIGAIKLKCYEYSIPLHIQFASEVKSRWSDDVLVNTGTLERRGNRLYFNDRMTNDHQRDALRHALHFWRYGNHELKKTD